MKNLRGSEYFPYPLYIYHRSVEGYLSVCDEDTANSVARVAAVAQVFVGYFENTVAGKITEPWVAVFWATFIIYRGCPKCI